MSISFVLTVPVNVGEALEAYDVNELDVSFEANSVIIFVVPTVSVPPIVTALSKVEREPEHFNGANISTSLVPVPNIFILSCDPGVSSVYVLKTISWGVNVVQFKPAPLPVKICPFSFFTGVPDVPLKYKLE